MQPFRLIGSTPLNAKLEIDQIHTQSRAIQQEAMGQRPRGRQATTTRSGSNQVLSATRLAS